MRSRSLLLAALLGLTLAAARPATAVTSSARVVAQAHVKLIGIYRSPQAKKPFMRLANPSPISNDESLVFLVKQRANGWEQVYLPLRPNGTTGWVRDRDVTLSLDPYRVVVSLSAHEVTVWNGKLVVLRTPAGVGRSVLPTPSGTYYLVELLKQPDPNGLYGPYAFGLSAYSNVLLSFGGGPGQIGLHGTNEPSRLGTDVSHGCVRVSNDAITRLARLLPLGTPVSIVR